MSSTRRRNNHNDSDSDDDDIAATQRRLDRHSRHSIRSNVPLAMCLWLNWYFLPFYYLLSLFTFVYKRGAQLQYESDTWYNMEVTFLVLLAILEVMALFAGDRGNKLQSVASMFLFQALALFNIIGNAYFLSYQTYVLQLDYIIGVFATLLSVAEFCFGVMAIVSFGDRVVH